MFLILTINHKDLGEGTVQTVLRYCFYENITCFVYFIYLFFASVTGQIHLQSGEVLLFMEKDTFQNKSDGQTGS